MKKSILTFGLLLFTVSASHSATVVSGSLDNATWNKAGSPYEVQGAAAIPAGVTVKAGPGVLVVFAPGASLEVRGTLIANGEAAYPTQFRIPAGGGYLLVKGGELSATDAKFVGGFFVVEDGKVEVVASEITGGSGPYLRGATTAVFRSNKIYGNSCGFTLDGDQVQAKFTFNTLVMNTYGLHLKKYATLTLENNSIHDNAQFQVVNDLNTPAVLSNNFWGSDNAALVPVRGAAKLDPMKTMKEVLREYVMTQLPNLPQKKLAQVTQRAKAEKVAAKASAKKADALRKSQAIADAKAEKAKQLAEKKAARVKALADKRAAEKAALEAKIKEVAPAEASVSVAPTAEPAKPEASASFGNLEENKAAPAIEAPAVSASPADVTSTNASSPAAIATPAPAVADKAAGALSMPSNEAPDIPGLEVPPTSPAVATSSTAAAPVVENATAPAVAVATETVSAASAVTPVAAPAVVAPATGAPAIPAGTDSFNANMIPAPPATATTSTAPADLGGLDLPPLNDKPIQAPKDMDLPTLDDLGVPAVK
jgi:hypothetical protein